MRKWEKIPRQQEREMWKSKREPWAEWRKARPPPNILRFFKLRPRNYTANLRKLPIPGTIDVTLDMGNVPVRQFLVNANIATTCHKLQGMTKKNIVITEWGTHKNWVYVVWSTRVTKILGLFLLKNQYLRFGGTGGPQEFEEFRNQNEESGKSIY